MSRLAAVILKTRLEMWWAHTKPGWDVCKTLHINIHSPSMTIRSKRFKMFNCIMINQPVYRNKIWIEFCCTRDTLFFFCLASIFLPIKNFSHSSILNICKVGISWLFSLFGDTSCFFFLLCSCCFGEDMNILLTCYSSTHDSVSSIVLGFLLTSRFFNCVQKAVMSVHCSWDVGFKRPKTILLCA